MKHLINGLKGMAVGVANIIPGVSGGTMAFILGIYEDLVKAIGDFFTDKSKRKEYFIFLLVIAIGAGIGIIIFAKVFSFLLDNLKQPTYFLFAGLIAGSVPFIMKIHTDMKMTAGRILMLLAGIGIIVSLSIIHPVTSETKTEIKTDSVEYIEEIWEEKNGVVADKKKSGKVSIDTKYGLWLSLCGFLTAGSMIVPGFSGSALLLALGEYANVLSFVNNLDIKPLIFFSFGAILGILVFAKIIALCLKKFPSATYYFILGLVLASFYQMWLEVRGDFSFQAGILILSIVAFGIGFFVAFILSKVNTKKA
jgi:putative membrane protein